MWGINDETKEKDKKKKEEKKKKRAWKKKSGDESSISRDGKRINLFRYAMD